MQTAERHGGARGVSRAANVAQVLSLRMDGLTTKRKQAMNQAQLDSLWQEVEATAYDLLAIDVGNLSVAFIHASATLQAMLVFPSGYKKVVIHSGVLTAGSEGPVTYIRKREAEDSSWEAWQSC